MSARLLTPVLASALGLALAATAGPAAFAQPLAREIVVDSPMPLQPGHELRHATVKFSDLDINTEAGARTLVGRIRGAARRVCAPEPHSSASLRDRQNFRDCRAGAMSTTVAQLNNPHVQQAYDALK
jgi:UrcA family protein